MSNRLGIFNRQRAVNLNIRLLRLLTMRLLEIELQCRSFEICVFLTGKKRMAILNETHLGHSGPTDVITFDYGDRSRPDWLGGDIFVCVPVAIEQAGEFRTSWQEETLRYIIHGILHLCGMEDTSTTGYRRMKREEKRLLKRLVPGSGLARLGKVR